MFVFEKNLYIGESVQDIEFIKLQLKKSIGVYDIFLICIDVGGKNFVEILHSTELFKPFNRNKKYKIIGIANTRKEVQKLLVEIIQNFINLEKDLKQFKNFYIAGEE